MVPVLCYISGMEKVCAGCGVSKPSIEGFHADKRRKDGRRRVCKECNIERVRAWQSAHPERVKALNAAWRRGHPEAGRVLNTRWRREHRESRNAASAEWRRGHPDGVRARNARYNARKRAYSGTNYTAADVATLLVDQHGLCAYCGGIMSVYHVDHIEPISRGGGNGADNICLACPPCNLEKSNKRLLEWLLRKCSQFANTEHISQNQLDSGSFR
jgi:hypothetical protein